MTRSSPSHPVVPLEDRPFDVVLFGATGFTGKLVAEYFADHAEAAGVRWAIAGRAKDKLEAVRRDLAARDEGLHDLSILIADSHDVAALDALAPQTRVVCTTVGPYARYGLDLARACARHGTSYCDLTGEPTFVRTVIDECHDVARGTRARIVNCAGYDSIPSDLGAHMAWDHAHRSRGEGLSWVKAFTGRTKGAASGGTVASALGLMDAAKKSKSVRRLLLDPHGLDPERNTADGARGGAADPFEADQRGVRFDKDIERWTAPFVMASINTRVVRRSHALFREEGGGYGQRFHYNEAMSFARGPRGLVTASLVTAGLGGFFAAAALPPARRLLERFVLPAPGQGPSREAIESGFFELHVLAETESGRRLRGRVAGTKDPGYGETAKMLSESAMCLAKDGARLEPRFGVLTPATAMGMRLVERLRTAGMTFDVHDA
ncbi:MAG: saccharopine dehydrogenase NADP-binding domain-containing protein [Labilithrix sp.]|nr:saccharopine dehydrogenase NADP-binding domain-containing protein [Labilithrix sp.]